MSIEYDFVVESFYTEYKLNVDELMKIAVEYRNTSSESERFDLLMKFRRLYPEFQEDTLDIITDDYFVAHPDRKTVKKKVWFVQPPRDDATGKPLHFFSLKSRLLTRLRNLRKEVKALQKAAGKAGDKVNEIRYNAMQNAIKVIMNTEYGASGNKIFAHYDPDIAGAVTFLSRTLIGFLTLTLQSDTLYVDKKFLEENDALIQRLSSIQCITSITPARDMTDEEIYENRVRTLRRVYDNLYNVINHDIFKISIEKASVIYQDTDSNYYINPYIQRYYLSEHMTPSDIKECMVSMLAHNDFMNNFAVGTINRSPVGLGFEGAFIICRYFRRKKKYYGKKYESSLLPDVPPGEKWKPTLSCAPQDNGDYIYLDDSILLSSNEIVAHGKQKVPNAVVVNYLDYIKGQGIKCTGVNLARRDQYKFINYYHMLVIQTDMRLIKKNKEGEWELIKEQPLNDIIYNIFDRFRSVVQTYTELASGVTDIVPEGLFKLVDFSRPKPYDESKKGTMQKIVARMKEDEGAEQYIPENGERINVVVIMNDAIREARLKGTAGMGQTGERSFTVDELLEKTRRQLLRKKTFETTKKYPNPESIPMSECVDVQLDPAYVDAVACAELDFKYYLLSLIKAMTLYIVDEKYPSEIEQINQGLLTDEQAEELIDKLQTQLSKDILDEFYPPKTKTETNINGLKKASRKEYKEEVKSKKKLSKKYRYTSYTYKDMLNDEMIESNRNRILNDATSKHQRAEILLRHVQKVYKRLETDKYLEPIFADEIEQAIYEDFKLDKSKYEKEMKQKEKDIFQYEQVIKEMERKT